MLWVIIAWAINNEGIESRVINRCRYHILVMVHCFKFKTVVISSNWIILLYNFCLSISNHWSCTIWSLMSKTICIKFLWRMYFWISCVPFILIFISYLSWFWTRSLAFLASEYWFRNLFIAFLFWLELVRFEKIITSSTIHYNKNILLSFKFCMIYI
jgi:hypothetical protein